MHHHVTASSSVSRVPVPKKKAVLRIPLGMQKLRAIPRVNPELRGRYGLSLRLQLPGFSNGDNYCARMQGWCGEPTPICFIDNYDWYNCLYDSEMQCSLADGHDFCAVQGATDAEAQPQCVDVGLSNGCVLRSARVRMNLI